MQMSRTEILARLRDIVQDTLGADLQFTEQSRLMEDLGFSSVDMLYLIIATEESFGIRFENIGITDVKTVGMVADYIEAHLP